MTHDLVILTPRVPRSAELVDAIPTADDVKARQVADGAVIQLCVDAVPLVSIEVPLLVQVPGEVERLLGARPHIPFPVPVSWLEVHAAATARAVHLADAFATDLARRAGGHVWSAHPPTSGGPR